MIPANPPPKTVDLLASSSAFLCGNRPAVVAGDGYEEIIWRSSDVEKDESSSSWRGLLYIYSTYIYNVTRRGICSYNIYKYIAIYEAFILSSENMTVFGWKSRFHRIEKLGSVFSNHGWKYWKSTFREASQRNLFNLPRISQSPDIQDILGRSSLRSSFLLGSLFIC